MDSAIWWQKGYPAVEVQGSGYG